jgi:hypothetical protein
MKQCNIQEEVKLIWEIPGNASMIYVDASNSLNRGVIESIGAEHAGVVANIGSHPVGCGIQWI